MASSLIEPCKKGQSHKVRKAGLNKPCGVANGCLNSLNIWPAGKKHRDMVTRCAKEAGSALQQRQRLGVTNGRGGAKA